MSPALIKRATGFEVATIDPEGMEGTTVVNDELIGELSLLKLPPPNWMSSGVVTTTSGPALYEIVRVGTDRGLVLIRTDLSERMAALRRSLLWTSAIMILPAILFLAIGGLQRPPTGLPPVRPSSR
jgi:hypothetical protein